MSGIYLGPLTVKDLLEKPLIISYTYKGKKYLAIGHILKAHIEGLIVKHIPKED